MLAAPTRAHLFGAVTSVLLLISAPSANAEWTLGAGVGRTSDALISDARSLRPFPVLNYEGERWTLTLGSVRYRAWTHSWLEVSALANLRTSEVDNPLVRDDEAKRAFDGLDRDVAVDLGVGLTFPLATPIVIEYRQDAAGSDGGASLIAMAAAPLMQGDPVELSVALGGRWVDQEYIDYNYGVRASEARRNRPAYAAERASVIPFVGVDLRYSFRSNWILSWSASYERLADEVTASPLVEDAYIVTTDVALLRRF